jgi:hypothetical protein
MCERMDLMRRSVTPFATVIAPGSHMMGGPRDGFVMVGPPGRVLAAEALHLVSRRDVVAATVTDE